MWKTTARGGASRRWDESEALEQYCKKERVKKGRRKTEPSARRRSMTGGDEFGGSYLLPWRNRGASGWTWRRRRREKMGEMETLAYGDASGVAYKARAPPAVAGASCRRGSAGVRGERRGTSLRVKTTTGSPPMDAINGWQRHLPLRWHGLQPRSTSPPGWAGFKGKQRRKTVIFSI